MARETMPPHIQSVRRLFRLYTEFSDGVVELGELDVWQNGLAVSSPRRLGLCIAGINLVTVFDVARIVPNQLKGL